MRTIPLSGKRGAGLFAIVDDEDYELVAGTPWHLADNGYVRRTIGSKGAPGPRSETMHRVVLGLVHGDGVVADHRNGDRLDNRRGNLRPGTHALNSQNRGSSGGSSRFRGVYWSKHCRRWVAQVGIDGRKMSLGLFDDEIEAARAAQAKRLEVMPFAVEAPIR